MVFRACVQLQFFATLQMGADTVHEGLHASGWHPPRMFFDEVHDVDKSIHSFDVMALLGAQEVPTSRKQRHSKMQESIRFTCVQFESPVRARPEHGMQKLLTASVHLAPCLLICIKPPQLNLHSGNREFEDILKGTNNPVTVDQQQVPQHMHQQKLTNSQRNGMQPIHS